MVAARISVPISPSRKRPHKGGGAAPKSGAAVAARLLRRNRPTEAVPARPSGRNRAGTGQEPHGRTTPIRNLKTLAFAAISINIFARFLQR